MIISPPPLPYRIFAVDPATGDSGWAVLEVTSLHPLKIDIIDHGHVDGQKLLRTRKEMVQIFQRQFCILDALEYEYDRLVNLYQPHQIVSEGAFGHVHLSALISLTLAINVLRRVSYRLLKKDIVESPPTITKKAFTGHGGADKEMMRKFYHSNKFLSGTVKDEDISEHEIDAIAHGCGHVRRDLIGDVEQVSAKDKKKAKLEKAKKKAEREGGA